jgi:hypothetical protein
MAIQTTLVDSSLNIMFKAGIDDAGRDVIKAKKYNNIKVTASAENLLSVGTAIGNLMKNELVEIQRSDDSVILNA